MALRVGQFQAWCQLKQKRWPHPLSSAENRTDVSLNSHQHLFLCVYLKSRWGAKDPKHAQFDADFVSTARVAVQWKTDIEPSCSSPQTLVPVILTTDKIRYEESAGMTWNRSLCEVFISANVHLTSPGDVNGTLNRFYARTRYSGLCLIKNDNFQDHSFQYCSLLQVIDAGHRDELHALSIHPDGMFLFSGAHDQLLKVWDITPPPPPGASKAKHVTAHQSFIGHSAAVTSILPAGDVLVTSDAGDCLLFWTLRDPCVDLLTERSTVELADAAQRMSLQPFTEVLLNRHRKLHSHTLLVGGVLNSVHV